MKRYIFILFALLFLAPQARTQNEIDHVNSLYWSGYGKMAINGDTLYLNSLKGHGVERYYIADPANPVFIDRENISGFDQINFERRLMAKANSGQLKIIDFTNFESAITVSNISLSRMRSWKLASDYIFIVLESDSLQTIGIADPANPVLINTAYLSELGGYPSIVVFGSSIVAIQRVYGNWDTLYVYRINEPDNIHLIHSEPLLQPINGGAGIDEARGDTIAMVIIGRVGYWWNIYMVSYAPNDTSHLPSWGESSNGHPPVYYSNDNALIFAYFYAGVIAYSFNNFTALGKAPDPITYGGDSYAFDCTSDYHFITATHDSLSIFEPTYSDTIIMPLLASTGPAHYGILSSCAYGNYILSGAESNGGELLIHELDQSGNLNLISVLPDVQAKEIQIDGSMALCLCPDKMAAVDLSNPVSPAIRHEIAGFNGPLIDFYRQDTLLFVVTDRAYNIVRYDDENGFSLHSTLDLPGGSITSIVHYGWSYILKGAIGTVIKINPHYNGQPYVMGEFRLPHENYVNLDLGWLGLGASGEAGLDILNLLTLEPVRFYGPEYFADARQFIFSGETLYVADGIGGVKIYTSVWGPNASLSFVGGYGTGNVVNQVARIGDDFIISDYYSLQHLRWGAPTGIEPEPNTQLPQQFTLEQNYPNPFNAQTTIRYNLPHAADITLDIYDLLGRKVETLVRGRQTAGEHNVIWDAAGTPSGVYFYRIKAGEFVDTKRCLLIK